MERLGLKNVDEVRKILQTCKRKLAPEVERILIELRHTRSLLRPDSDGDDQGQA